MVEPLVINAAAKVIARWAASAIAGENDASKPALLREQNIKITEETSEAVRYPLDNKHGNAEVSIQKELSHSLATETSVTQTRTITAKLSASALEVLKAEISAQLSRQTGHKIGEVLTRKETITMAAKPGTSVTYLVEWVRSVRTGECVFSVGSEEVVVPYRTSYDLRSKVSAEKS